MNQRLQLGAMALEGVTVVFEAPEAPGRRGNHRGVPQSQGLDGVGRLAMDPIYKNPSHVSIHIPAPWILLLGVCLWMLHILPYLAI